MKIEEINIRMLENAGKVKAMVDVNFDNCFVVKGLKIIDGANGEFVAMPSRKLPDGTYQDTAFPITAEFRQVLCDAILNKHASEDSSTPDSVVDEFDDDDDLPF